MKLTIYRRADGLYAWRLQARNGRVIATDGGQGYAKRATCRDMALEVITSGAVDGAVSIVVEP